MTAPARVAVNLRAVGREDVRRGDALLTPDVVAPTTLVDARIDRRRPAKPRRDSCGCGRSACTIRRLAPDGVPGPLWSGSFWTRRCHSRWATALLLRDPGRRQVVGGATVLDPAPPSLRRRGAARARAASLAAAHGTPDRADELARRARRPASSCAEIGVPVRRSPAHGVVAAGTWLVTAARWEDVDAGAPQRHRQSFDRAPRRRYDPCGPCARAAARRSAAPLAPAAFVPGARGQRRQGPQARERSRAAPRSRTGGVTAGRVAPRSRRSRLRSSTSSPDSRAWSP